MKRTSWIAGAVVVLGVGCAGAQKPQALTGKFDATGLHGEAVQLDRAGGRIHGTAYARPVELEIDGTQIHGRFRELPVKLGVSLNEVGTIVKGEFDGAAAAFQYTPHRIEGYLSGCAFLLEHRQGSQYQGARACGGARPVPLTVNLPPLLTQFSDAERAAWLAVILAGHEQARSVGGAGVAYAADGNDARITANVCALRDLM